MITLQFHIHSLVVSTNLTSQCVFNHVVQVAYNSSSCIQCHITGTILFHASLCTMHMTVEVNTTTVHLVPLPDRVVQHDNDLTVMIVTQILVNFFKLSTECWVVQQLAVMIAFNQNLCTVQTAQDINRILSRQESKVTQDECFILWGNIVVPLFNHLFAHVLYILESCPSYWAKIHNVLVTEMQVTCNPLCHSYSPNLNSRTHSNRVLAGIHLKCCLRRFCCSKSEQIQTQPLSSEKATYSATCTISTI